MDITELQHQDSKDLLVLFITYNRSDLLEAALNAIKMRTELGSLSREYVVSDDGSSPEHLARVRALPFDKHVFSQSNSGLGATATGVSPQRVDAIFFKSKMIASSSGGATRYYLH